MRETNRKVLQFRQAPDEVPADEADIFYVDEDRFNGAYNIVYGHVEWSWDDGNGSQYTYAEPGTKRLIQISSKVLPEKFLWFPASDIDTLLAAGRED